MTVIPVGMVAYDTWITFSAQSEPITIFFGLTLGYLLLKLPKQMNGSQAILLGGIALLASATHYVGWFLTVQIAVILGLNFIRHIRSVRSQTHQLDNGFPIGKISLGISCSN